MSLRANALKSNEGQRKAIAKEVNCILGQMDDELKNAHEQGKHAVGIRVPITFSVPYMANKDAQRTIYYKLLTSLLERDYVVKIQLEENESVFHVTWLSEDEEKDIDVQNALIAKHTIVKKTNTKL